MRARQCFRAASLPIPPFIYSRLEGPLLPQVRKKWLNSIPLAMLSDQCREMQDRDEVTPDEVERVLI